MERVERGEPSWSEEVGSQRIYSEYRKWRYACDSLKVVKEWLGEEMPLLKRGLHLADFDKYLWEYVVNDKKGRGFLKGRSNRNSYSLQSSQMS